jgi:hypothetical protein
LKNCRTSHTPPALIAWHVAERADKKFWTRLGAAWNHEDGGGMTLQLDLMPVAGGRIVLRAPNTKRRRLPRRPLSSDAFRFLLLQKVLAAHSFCCYN